MPAARIYTSCIMPWECDKCRTKQTCVVETLGRYGDRTRARCEDRKACRARIEGANAKRPESVAFINFQHPDNGIPCTVEYLSDGTLTLEDEADEFDATPEARAEIKATRARLAGQICTDLAAATYALREEGITVAREGGWNA